MSCPTNGGTDRDAVGSVSAHHLPSFSRPPPSYSISRSQIVSNGLSISRKRSHSGESVASQSQSLRTPPRVAFATPLVSFLPAPAPSIAASSSPELTATAAASLRCQLPIPPSAKRLRREPPSPTSVGEVSDAKKLPPPAKAAATPGAAQMQSILRGLQHMASCNPIGCHNPLCVSSRAFVEKVTAHRKSMEGKATHDANRCGACKLWAAIVRAHAPSCSAKATCRVPGCSPQP